MMHMPRLLVAVLALAFSVGLAACGSSSDTTSSTDGSETTTASTSFTYGYSVPTGQNPWINTIAEAAKATAAEAGGEMELADSQLDPAKAVGQLNRFLVQGDKAVAVAPAQVPEALIGPLQKAASEGVAVFALEWSFAADPAAPPQAPAQGQVNIDRAKLGEEVAEAVNDGASGNSSVIYVGLPFPVASLDFFEQSMRESLGDSEIVADVDNPTDNAEGALGPLNGALAANPDATAIVTYNGPSALAAVKAVESAGLEGQVKIYNIQLDTATAKALEEGRIEAAWDLNAPDLGEALGGLIAAAGSGEPESEWAKTVVVDAVKYDGGDVGSWERWDTGG
jgi:ABC-type sugar transport system substrate-binding protein